MTTEINTQEALSYLGLIAQKWVKLQENQINKGDSEEDIEMKERVIRKIQASHQAVREAVLHSCNSSYSS